MTWTTQHDRILEAGHKAGKFARDIAAELTAAGYPATKNTVLGRVFRNGWSSITAKPAPVDLTVPTGCRWIHGEAAGFQSKWCDAPISRPGESWCEEHRARVFRPRDSEDGNTKEAA